MGISLVNTFTKLDPAAKKIAFDLIDRVIYCHKTAPDKQLELQQELAIIQEAHGIVAEKDAEAKAEAAKVASAKKLAKAMEQPIESNDSARWARPGKRAISNAHMLPGAVDQGVGSRKRR